MSEPSQQRHGVLAAGNWIVDHVKVIDGYPDQDALAFIGHQELSNGGGPFNILMDLHKLGADFPLAGAGLVGEDANGKWIIDDCVAHGIDVARLQQTDRAPTSYTDVMTAESSGRRTFFHQIGTNALLTEDDVDLTGGSERFFYLGYLLLLEALDAIDELGKTGASRVLRRATDAGFETVVDLVSAQSGDFRKVVTPSLPEIDTLFLNELEAANLLGGKLDPVSQGALTEAASAVLDLGVRRRVILHSAHGAVAVERSGEQAAQGAVDMPEGDIRGASGAGDAFAAGVIFALHDDQGLEECLRYGACTAAGCLTQPSTSGGVMPLANAIALGEHHGFREFED